MILEVPTFGFHSDLPECRVEQAGLVRFPATAPDTAHGEHPYWIVRQRYSCSVVRQHYIAGSAACCTVWQRLPVRKRSDTS